MGRNVEHDYDNPEWTELKDARQKANMTQDDLAAAVGMSTAQISAYETGRSNRLAISFGNALSLARALGVTAEELAGDVVKTGRIRQNNNVVKAYATRKSKVLEVDRS